MILDHLFEIFYRNANKQAFVWNDKAYTYSWLLKAIAKWMSVLDENKLEQGSVVAFQADFSPNAIALLICLIKKKAIIAPLIPRDGVKQAEYCSVAEAGWLIKVEKNDEVSFSKFGIAVKSPLLADLIHRNHPGLIIFSSGSTGKSKAAVHDVLPLLNKFSTPKRSMRTIGFLLFDHIGGFNTLFYTLYNAGCLIIPKTRSPKDVCQAIDMHKADALTTTPTFLNLFLLSEFYRKYDVSSLRVINYGTEVMSEPTLLKLRDIFPAIRFSQAYGLSEVGVLPVRSKSSDSLYIKIDAENFQTRIVDGLLEIKSPSSMLGYLNAPNPFTADGWFKTGDAVEVDGDYLRILGRHSELINVGGEKVYPIEIENVLQQMNGVEQVAVFSEPNAFTGQIVVARIKLKLIEDLAVFRARLYEYCRTRLPVYQIPQKIILTNSGLYNDRFKTIRKNGEST